MASLLTVNLGVWQALVSEKQVNVLTPSIPSDLRWIWSKMFVKLHKMSCVELLCSKDGNYLWRTIYMDGTRTLHNPVVHPLTVSFIYLVSLL